VWPWPGRVSQPFRSGLPRRRLGQAEVTAESDRGLPSWLLVQGDHVPDEVPMSPRSRRDLDALDTSLVHVPAWRSNVILDVSAYERANSTAVVDRDREDRMLARREATAVCKGLDPRIARRVLRSVIDAFTLLDVEELGPDPS